MIERRFAKLILSCFQQIGGMKYIQFFFNICCCQTGTFKSSNRLKILQCRRWQFQSCYSTYIAQIHYIADPGLYADKKENKIFLIYKEIQIGSGAKLYMRTGFTMYEGMRKFFTIYEEAVSHIWLWSRSLWISLYMRNILFSFLSVYNILYEHIIKYC